MNQRELYRAAFGESMRRSSGKKVPHNMTGKIVGKWYCKRCGLVALNNEPTRKAIKAGYDND